MNQYDVRQVQIQDIIQERQAISQQKQEWDYDKLTNTVMMAPRFKYQNVEMSHNMQFVQDVKGLVYDQRSNVQDANLLGKWDLAPFDQKLIKVPQGVPPQCRIVKKGLKTQQFDSLYGKFQLQGNINAKSNQINFNLYHYNLRSNSIFFYPPETAQCQKQRFYIQLNERTYDYTNFSTDYYLLRSQIKNVRIKRDQLSTELIRSLERKLFKLSFMGAFALRDQVPPWQMEDYIEGHIDRIGPINFQKESHLKEIVKTKYYRQSLGAFFTLLKRFSENRNNLGGQVMLPRWLKSQLKELPRIQINLITNIVPINFSLHFLKIKLQQHQIQTLVSSLKNIFPFYKNYLKRTFIVYDSQLSDQNVKYILNQISYPMYTIGFPSNNLSMVSLEYCIESASNLYQQVIDYSYNTKLTSIGSNIIFSLINTNPSIKKLILKGCYVEEGSQGDFFEALTNNLCLCELQIDFLDHYGNACIKYLNNYGAQIY